MPIEFTKATKKQLPARIALAGPTGSGKTFSALEIAQVFTDKVVLIDTEHGSGALYADLFDYDYFRFDPPYDPTILATVIESADDQGFEMIVVDSFSHFWEGEGGTIDIADAAGQRASGNSFAGWKVATPALRHLVDTMLDLRSNLIVTMRSKMEYVIEQDSRGKQIPRKIGMAPVMRQGIEYEFTLVGDIDLEHRIIVSKSRCSTLADQVIQPGRAKELGETFKHWLESGEAIITGEQSQELQKILNGIEDPEERKVAKRAWKAEFGMPDRLEAARFDAALKDAQRRAGVEPAETEPADAEPEPEEAA